MYRTCPADAVIFLSEDDFRVHMVDHHRVSLSEDSVLLLIAKTCRRVVASRPDANIDCPVCLLSIPNKRSKIGRHLGRHMEDIALPIISLVVPTDEDTDASDKSDEEVNSDNEDPPPYINHLAPIDGEDAEEAGLDPVNSLLEAKDAPESPIRNPTLLELGRINYKPSGSPPPFLPEKIASPTPIRPWTSSPGPKSVTSERPPTPGAMYSPARSISPKSVFWKESEQFSPPALGLGSPESTISHYWTSLPPQ